MDTKQADWLKQKRQELERCVVLAEMMGVDVRSWDVFNFLKIIAAQGREIRRLKVQAGVKR